MVVYGDVVSAFVIEGDCVGMRTVSIYLNTDGGSTCRLQYISIQNRSTDKVAARLASNGIDVKGHTEVIDTRDGHDGSINLTDVEELDICHGSAVSGHDDIVLGWIIVIDIVTINGLRSDRGGPFTAGLRVRRNDVSFLIYTDDADTDGIDPAYIIELDIAYGCAVSSNSDIIGGLMIIVDTIIVNGVGIDCRGSCSASLSEVADHIADFIDAGDIDIHRINLTDVMELDLTYGCTIGGDSDIIGSLIVVINIITIDRLSGNSSIPCSAGLVVTVNLLASLVNAYYVDVYRIYLTGVMELNLIRRCTVCIDNNIIRGLIVIIDVITADRLSCDCGRACATSLCEVIYRIAIFIHADDIDVDGIDLADIVELDVHHGCAVCSDSYIVGCLIAAVDFIAGNRLG